MKRLTLAAASLALTVGLMLITSPAQAQAAPDAAQQLRNFLRDTPSGKGNFTQTVTAADGLRQKVSAGSFEFLRPSRFKFVYTKPFDQTLLADGSKLWIYDPDLRQASSRKLDGAIDSTPAALLASGQIERDFALKAEGPRDGLDWVLATPKLKDGSLRELRVGFKGKEPAAIDILDNFGQRSVLRFSGFQALPIAAEGFVFKPPAGVDIIEQ